MKNLTEYNAKTFKISGGGNSQQNVSKPLFDEGSRITLLYPCYTLALTLRRGSSALARLLRVSCATLALLLTLGVGQVGARTFNGTTDKIYIYNTGGGIGDGWRHADYKAWATFGTTNCEMFLECGTEGSKTAIYYVIPPAGTFTTLKLGRGSSVGSRWDENNETYEIPIDESKNYISSYSAKSSEATWSNYPFVFTEETVLYFTITNDWWNNTTCYHYVKFKWSDNTYTSSLPAYNLTSYTANNNTLSTVSTGTADVVYFVTVPSGTYKCCNLERKESDSSTGTTWNTTNDISLSTENNKGGTIQNEGSSVSWTIYKPTSTASLAATSTNITTAQNSTLTPSLTSNTRLNNIKSTSYAVTTNPDGAGSVTSAGVFSATAAGTYTVTATVTYNAKGFPDLTSTTTATKTITVTDAGVTHSITYKDQGDVTYSGSNGASLPALYSEGTGIPTLTDGVKAGYTFGGWYTNSDCTGSPVTSITTTAATDITLYAKWTQDNYTINLTAGDGGSITSATSFTNQHYGDEITITAASEEGKRFKQWTVTSGTATIASTTTASTTLTVTGNATVQAEFESEYYIGGTHLHYYDNWDSDHDAMEYNGSYYYCQMTYASSVSDPWSGGFVQFKIYAHPSEQQYPYGTSGFYGTLRTPQGTVELGKSGDNVQVTGSNVWTDGTQFYICFDPSLGIWAQTADPTRSSLTFSPASGIGIKNTNTSVTVTTANIDNGTTVTFTLTNSSSADVTPAAHTATVSSNAATWNFTAPATAGTYTITASATIGGTEYTDTYTLTVYDQLYAFIQGRFHVYDKSASGWTNTFSSGDWDVNSTAIPMTYDSENNRFYLRTYATPQELSNQISSYDPYFFIKTSTSSSSLENVTPYWSATSTTLSDAGFSNKRTLVHTGDVQVANLRFNSSATDRNVVLYFDGEAVWYELEAQSVDITAIGLSATRIPPMATVTAMPTIDARGASGDKAYCWQLFSNAGCTTEVPVSFTSLGDGRVSFPAPVTQSTYYLRLQVHSDDGCASTLDDEEVVSFTVTTSDMVFFRNVPNWGSVHVYFLGTSAYWDNDQGSGCAGRDNGDAHGMTRIPNTNIYYYDYYGNGNVVFNGSGAAYIAFTDNYKPNSTNFSGCQAVYRGDFSACAPMYVPENYITDYKNTSAVDGQAAYYNRGYWTNYMSAASGFTLYVYDGISGDGIAEVESHAMTGTAGDYTYRYTYDFSSSGRSTPWTYGFKVEGCGGSWYGAGNTMTVDNCTNWNLFTGTANCGLTVNANMEHTFVLTLTGDGHVQMSVEYPLSVGDYRLIYDDDTQNPHPSQYIRKRANGKDTVAMFVRSLHNPALKVQYCYAIEGETVTWRDYGAAVSYTDRMGTDTAGVYLFYLEQDGSGALTVNTAETRRYVGLYYIRTNNVDGGWTSYKTTPDNRMTYAAYPLEQGYGFDYYKAKWVSPEGANVTYTIACDYSEALSDTLLADPDNSPLSAAQAQSLPQAANVRFGWNSRTNRLTRAYISGSTIISDRFLVLQGDEKMKDKDGNPLAISGLNEHEMNFTDLGNWIYRADIKADPGAAVKLTAKYNGNTQYFIGTDETPQEIIGGTTGDARTLRVTYDFKINRLMTAWLPDGDEITDNITLKADMMLIRKGQEAATQITFASGKKIDEIKSVYGVMEFRKQDIAGKFPDWSGRAYEFLMYYISFPFDVRVHDIFGAGTMGENWIIQKYNGAKRAQIGWFAETSTFWETLPADSTLHAYEGYLLLLDRISFNDPENALWAYIPSGGSIYLYFPSASHSIGTISDATKTITVPSHVCGIDRTFTPVGESFTVSHKYTDSHWNVIGTPLFATTNASTVGTPVADGAEGTTLQYYYAWDCNNNTLSVAAAPNASATFTTSSPEFRSMHGYMVQYAGEVTFVGAAINNTVSPAPRRVQGKQNYRVELHAVHENGTVSPTFVELRENACDTFALNEDMYMIRSSRTADLYSFAGSYDVAANVLSLDNHTVPLGLEVKQAGTYRFTMPSYFTGTVTLLDKTTGTRTNLALGDYEVYLDRGAVNNRFELILSVSQITTSVGTVGGDGNGNVRKFLHNGQLYILKEGVVYDARGARVQ